MRIFCGGAQCGAYLGEVGASVSSLNPNPVWRIASGWMWRFPPGMEHNGILEKIDQDFKQPARLRHEVFGVNSATDQRLNTGREANLPIVVRCPTCHRLRYVTPAAVMRPVDASLVRLR